MHEVLLKACVYNTCCLKLLACLFTATSFYGHECKHTQTSSPPFGIRTDQSESQFRRRKCHFRKVSFLSQDITSFGSTNRARIHLRNCHGSTAEPGPSSNSYLLLRLMEILTTTPGKSKRQFCCPLTCACHC